MSIFPNLDWADGQVSIPGIRPVAYYIPKTHISVWPELLAVPVTESDEVTYVGNFTLVALKTWKRINLIVDKSPVESTVQGETRSKSFLNKATMVTALTTKGATAFAKNANNSDFVFLVQEKSGAFRMLGNEMFNTVTSVDQKIGAAPSDEKGTTIKVEVTDMMPAPFYEGDILTDSGAISAAS